MNEYLTDEAKRQLIEANLLRFASDSFAHELNRQVAIANGNDEAVNIADEAIATISAATEVYKQELDNLNLE